MLWNLYDNIHWLAVMSNVFITTQEQWENKIGNCESYPECKAEAHYKKRLRAAKDS